MSQEIRLINKNFIEPNVFSEKILGIIKMRGYDIETSNDEFGIIYKVYNSNKSDFFSIDLPNVKDFNKYLNYSDNKYGVLVQISFSNHVEEEDLDNFIFPFIKDIIDFFPTILTETGSDDYYTYEEFIKLNEE